MRTLYTLVSKYAYVYWSTWPPFVYVLPACNAGVLYKCTMRTLFTLMSIYAYVYWSTWQRSCAYFRLVMHHCCINAPCGHCLRWCVLYAYVYWSSWQRSCAYFRFVMHHCCIKAPCGPCLHWWCLCILINVNNVRVRTSMPMYIDVRDQRPCTYFLFVMQDSCHDTCAMRTLLIVHTQQAHYVETKSI